LAGCSGPAATASAKTTSAGSTPAGHSAGATTTGTETRARSPSSATTASAAWAFRGKNHLQEFVGIFKEVFELVALGAESLRGKLRGHLDPRHGRIFRDVAYLVDLDARFTSERRLQLFCERGRFGVTAWKTAYEAGKLRLRQIGREVNAGNTRACQQLRKTFFTRGRAEWHTVEQNLIPRGSKQ
jgi:hypothetical protein